MDDLLSTDNLLAQTRKQTSMRDMKSSRQIRKSPSSTLTEQKEEEATTASMVALLPPRRCKQGDLDAFFSTTTTTTTTRQTHTQHKQQRDNTNSIQLVQKMVFIKTTLSWTSSPLSRALRHRPLPPPLSSCTSARTLQVKNMAASSTSATTNSSIDDLFGMSSGAESSSPGGNRAQEDADDDGDSAYASGRTHTESSAIKQ